MNFIAHYDVSPYQESPLTVFGNLLPDLYRGFSKDYNKILSQIAPNENPLLTGIDFHIKTDKLFHNHHFFVKKNKELTLAIQANNLAKKHTYIIAHVLFELLLDNFLITKNNSLLAQFYTTLDKIDDDFLLRNLKLYFDYPQANKIFRIFKSFKHNKYAFHLKNAEGITNSLQHIIGNKMNLEFKTNTWLPFIEQYISTYNSSFEEFIMNLKSTLYNA